MLELQEKIAKSLMPKEQALAASFYGKFFARNLNLYLLQRRPQDWRNMQSEKKRAHDQQQQTSAAAAATAVSSLTPTPAESNEPPQSEKRKRKHRPDNEIDALFEEKLGKRIKKAALADEPSILESPASKRERGSGKPQDKELQQILGAIRSAPSGDKKRH